MLLLTRSAYSLFYTHSQTLFLHTLSCIYYTRFVACGLHGAIPLPFKDSTTVVNIISEMCDPRRGSCPRGTFMGEMEPNTSKVVDKYN